MQFRWGMFARRFIVGRTSTVGPTEVPVRVGHAKAGPALRRSLRDSASSVFMMCVLTKGHDLCGAGA